MCICHFYQNWKWIKFSETWRCGSFCVTSFAGYTVKTSPDQNLPRTKPPPDSWNILIWSPVWWKDCQRYKCGGQRTLPKVHFAKGPFRSGVRSMFQRFVVSTSDNGFWNRTAHMNAIQASKFWQSCGMSWTLWCLAKQWDNVFYRNEESGWVCPYNFIKFMLTNS